MGKYRMTAGKDDRPVFTSNGIRVLHASGCDTQISLLDPKVLKDKFGAELLLDNVKLNPYWQIGECVGASIDWRIFRLTAQTTILRVCSSLTPFPLKNIKRPVKIPDS